MGASAFQLTPEHPERSRSQFVILNTQRPGITAQANGLRSQIVISNETQVVLRPNGTKSW